RQVDFVVEFAQAFVFDLFAQGFSEAAGGVRSFGQGTGKLHVEAAQRDLSQRVRRIRGIEQVRIEAGVVANSGDHRRASKGVGSGFPVMNGLRNAGISEHRVQG